MSLMKIVDNKIILADEDAACLKKAYSILLELTSILEKEGFDEAACSLDSVVYEFGEVLGEIGD